MQADRVPSTAGPPHQGRRARRRQRRGASTSISHLGRGAPPAASIIVHDRGAALVEFAIVSLLLATIIFATLDYGRVAKVQNQLSNAAREGAAVAEINPTWVDRGCQNGTNVLDRTDRQDPGLSDGGTDAGYTVTVAKRLADGTLRPYTGCGTASSAEQPGPGDRVVVTVTRDIDLYSPMAAVVVGQTVRLSRKVEVVVQG